MWNPRKNLIGIYNSHANFKLQGRFQPYKINGKPIFTYKVDLLIFNPTSQKKLIRIYNSWVDFKLWKKNPLKCKNTKYTLHQ